MRVKPGLLLYNYLHLMQFDIHKAMMCHKMKHYSDKINGIWLDIGAGNGPYAKYFSSADKYLTTNTKRHYSPDAIEKLNEKTTFWIEDGTVLPIDDNSLDGVACFQVLSVINKPDVFFQEICRVLKPSGNLLLTTDFLYPVWSNEDRNRHTAFNLRDLAIKNRFTNISTESFGGFWSMNYALFMRYIRSYPDIWKKKSPWNKVFSLFPYLVFLVMLPMFSLCGMLIFLIEKNSDSVTDFTFNILFSAEKKQD